MSRQWSSEEIKLLQALCQKFNGKRWKKISKRFSTQGFHRSQYQCRNKWVNFLNPQINHHEWTEEELRILYAEYDRFKSQWSLIQKSLSSRTQVKIRNQFYGTIRNILRFLFKYYKKIGGHWSQLSNRIKPEILQNLYSGEKEFQFVGSVMREAITEMGFKFDKIKFVQILEKSQPVFQKINDLILEELPNIDQIRQNQGSGQVENLGQEEQNRPVEQVEISSGGEKIDQNGENIHEQNPMQFGMMPSIPYGIPYYYWYPPYPPYPPTF